MESGRPRLSGGPEADDIAHQDRPMEFHAIHADQHRLLPGPIGLADLVLGRHGAGQIDVAQDHAAENRAVRD